MVLSLATNNIAKVVEDQAILHQTQIYNHYKVFEILLAIYYWLDKRYKCNYIQPCIESLES